jgi:hypothetical protein
MKMMKGIIIIVLVFLVLQVVAFRIVSADYSGNYCLSFSYNSIGSGDYVNFGQSSIYKANQLTIEEWVKPAYNVQTGSNSAYGHAWGAIAEHCLYSSQGYDYQGWWLGYNYGNGMLYFIVWYSSNYYDWVSYHTNKAFWNSSSWYYVAVTYDPTLSNNNLVFYVNGSIDVQYNETHALYYSDVPLQVGASYHGAEQYVGLIDEFRYWNVSRTATEMQNSWNRTLINTETANSSLIGYWHFDDGSGSYAQDSSSYGNVGTLINSPQWIAPGAPIINDQTPPSIGNVYQQPTNQTGVLPTDQVIVYANITDDLTGVAEALLNYTTGNGTWNSAQMVNIAGNQYNATIPPFPYGTNVAYVITAEDGAGNINSTQLMGLTYSYEVTPEFPSFLILPLFMMATLLAVIASKKKVVITRQS